MKLFWRRVAIGGFLFVAIAVSAHSQAQEGCKVYFVIQPLDAEVLKLLATPVAPPNPSMFTTSDVQELVEWDLPTKVTAWQQRPSAEELARQWSELNQKWSPVRQSKDRSRTEQAPPQYLPYSVRSLPPDQWQDVKKWFAKEGPKKMPGLCVDSSKATYILSIGVVSGGSAGGMRPNASNPHEYEQLSAVRQQDNAVGPNGATYSPTAQESRYDEMNGVSGARDPSAHACTYLFRTNGPGGARQPTPDYYYCQTSGEMPRSTLVTMLKFLAKTGLP